MIVVVVDLLDEENVIVNEDVVTVLTEVEVADVAVAKDSSVGQLSWSTLQSPTASTQQQNLAQPVLGAAVEQVDPPLAS